MSFSSLIFETLSNYGRQLAFAIAPIPAYLPQYYTMCRSSNDPVLERKFPSSPHQKKNKSSSGSCHDFAGVLVDSCGASSSSSKTTSSSWSNTVATANSGGTVVYGRTHQITEAGFSSTSIMILLLSHVFRLQYFIGSAIIYNIHLYNHGNSNWGGAGAGAGAGGAKVDRIHLDLVTQSLVMVGVQLLLLSAVTRRRRMATKQKVHDDNDDDYNASNFSGDDGYSSPIFRNHKNTAAKESSMSQKPFIWVVRPRRYGKWDTVHQYMELIAVISVVMFVIGRYYLYPNDLLRYINTIKVISVLLESCLALPQLILNYQRQSTEGLSLVMVLGWIVGDVLKMVYFIMSSGFLSSHFTNNGHDYHYHHHGVVGGSGNRNVEDFSSSSSSSSSSSEDMSTFIVGCIFALIMDAIVGLQVCKYYPSRDMLNLMEKLRRFWRRFEILVLQIDIGPTSSGVGNRNSGGGCLDGSNGGGGGVDSMSCL
mmetsp:Transcript_1880/g.3411  ORF Transcript_1880/g.3411 Transcript_1880/m.3411 type:complete len:480 (-) Transcript_1880:788-2227(-)